MIIFRYIFKELYVSIIAITLVLLIIFITNQFVHYLQDAASGDITMFAVMQVMALQIPLLLGYLMPLALYLSILLVIGRLCIDSEMTVLYACGVSRAQILGIVMSFAVGVMIVVGVILLYFEPIVQGYRTVALSQAVAQASIAKIVPRRFTQLNKNIVFYTDGLSRSSSAMSNVFFAQREQPNPDDHLRPWDVTIAPIAEERYLPQGKGHFVIFKNGYRYIGVPGEKNYRIVRYAQYGMRLPHSSEHVNDWPNSVPTLQLWKDSHTLEKISSRRGAAAMLQWRIAMPITAILLALLAFPLSEVNPRHGKFAKFIPAILIYVGYADCIFLARAWIQKGIVSPALGMWWVHGSLLLIALTLLTLRTKIWQRIKR